MNLLSINRSRNAKVMSGLERAFENSLPVDTDNGLTCDECGTPDINEDFTEFFTSRKVTLFLCDECSCLRREECYPSGEVL